MQGRGAESRARCRVEEQSEVLESRENKQMKEQVDATGFKRGV